jgi:hypothetical protein
MSLATLRKINTIARVKEESMLSNDSPDQQNDRPQLPLCINLHANEPAQLTYDNEPLMLTVKVA